MGGHSLVQVIFLTQGSNPHLLYCSQILYPLSHQGAQSLLESSPFYRQENRLREIKLLAQGQNFNPSSPTPGFPDGSLVKNPTANAGDIKRHGFDPWVRKIPWMGAWQPTPVFLPGESRGQRNLAGYSPWVHKESNMTEQRTLALSFSQPSEKIQYCKFQNIITFYI